MMQPAVDAPLMSSVLRTLVPSGNVINLQDADNYSSIQKMYRKLFPKGAIIISFLNFYLVGKFDSNVAHQYKPVASI